MLAKLDTMGESEFQEKIQQLGGTEEAGRQKLLSIIIVKSSINGQKYPINEMFTYGISGNSIHLHLPGKLYEMLEELGPSKTIDTVNLYLLDAIEKIAQMRKNGFYRFQRTDSIYMISPVLRRKELKFLEKLDFQTHTYSKAQLNSNEFLQSCPEARLASIIFGANSKVGTVTIEIERITTPEWQAKKEEALGEFSKKEITMNKNYIKREAPTQ